MQHSSQWQSGGLRKKAILHLIFKIAVKGNLFSGDSPCTDDQGGAHSRQSPLLDFFHGKEKGSQSVALKTTVTRCEQVLKSHSDPK